MPRFINKKIDTLPSVGEQLILRREQKGVSIKEAAWATKISQPYLQALENSNYSQLPGEVYAKSFLRVYAKYLELDDQSLLVKYLSENKIFHKTGKTHDKIDIKKPVERIVWHNLMVTPRIIRNVIIGVLVVFCLIYLGIKITGIVSPPFLEISSPVNNLVTNQKIVEIQGRVEQEAVLAINGQLVLADQSGQFFETLVLQPGTNIIEVSAWKKHSKPAKIYQKVIVIEED